MFGKFFLVFSLLVGVAAPASPPVQTQPKGGLQSTLSFVGRCFGFFPGLLLGRPMPPRPQPLTQIRMTTIESLQHPALSDPRLFAVLNAYRSSDTLTARTQLVNVPGGTIPSGMDPYVVVLTPQGRVLRINRIEFETSPTQQPQFQGRSYDIPGRPTFSLDPQHFHDAVVLSKGLRWLVQNYWPSIQLQTDPNAWSNFKRVVEAHDWISAVEGMLPFAVVPLRGSHNYFNANAVIVPHITTTHRSSFVLEGQTVDRMSPANYEDSSIVVAPEMLDMPRLAFSFKNFKLARDNMAGLPVRMQSFVERAPLAIIEQLEQIAPITRMPADFIAITWESSSERRSTTGFLVTVGGISLKPTGYLFVDHNGLFVLVRDQTGELQPIPVNSIHKIERSPTKKSSSPPNVTLLEVE